jgi:prepilin signal peptidase PulO-like enzyme (type II secretory pathway)
MAALILFGALGGLVGALADAVSLRLAGSPRAAGEAGGLAFAAETRGGVLGRLQVQKLSGRRLARRMLIACVTALVFAAAGDGYDDFTQRIVIWAYLVVLIMCAAVDVLAFKVPNAITYPAIIGALVVVFLVPSADATASIVGGAAASGVLLVPALLTRGVGLGMGDVKLAAFAGLAVGIEHLSAMLLVMAVSGAAVAGLLLLTKRKRARDAIPYAPFIAAGAVATLVLHGSVFGPLG